MPHGCKLKHSDRPPAEVDLSVYFQVTPPSVHPMVLTLDKNGLDSRRPGVPWSIEVLVPPQGLSLLEFLLPSSDTEFEGGRPHKLSETLRKIEVFVARVHRKTSPRQLRHACLGHAGEATALGGPCAVTVYRVQE